MICAMYAAPAKIRKMMVGHHGSFLGGAQFSARTDCRFHALENYEKRLARVRSGTLSFRSHK